MRRGASFNRLTALAIVLALVLPSTACNVPGNQAKDSQAIVQGTGIAYLGTSMAATTVALAVSMTFSVIARNQTISESLLNSFQFDTLTMTTTSPVVGSTVSAITGVFYQVPSAGNILLIELDGGNKQGPGVTYSGHIHLAGHDNLGKPVTFDFDYGTATTQ